MEKLKSRKFIMAIFGALFVILNEGLDFGLPEDSIMGVVTIIVGYLVSQGWVDGKAEETKTSSKTSPEEQ